MQSNAVTVAEAMQVAAPKTAVKVVPTKALTGQYLSETFKAIDQGAQARVQTVVAMVAVVTDAELDQAIRDANDLSDNREPNPLYDPATADQKGKGKKAQPTRVKQAWRQRSSEVRQIHAAMRTTAVAPMEYKGGGWLSTVAAARTFLKDNGLNTEGLDAEQAKAANERARNQAAIKDAMTLAMDAYSMDDAFRDGLSKEQWLSKVAGDADALAEEVKADAMTKHAKRQADKLVKDDPDYALALVKALNSALAASMAPSAAKA